MTDPITQAKQRLKRATKALAAAQAEFIAARDNLEAVQHSGQADLLAQQLADSETCSALRAEFFDAVVAAAASFSAQRKSGQSRVAVKRDHGGWRIEVGTHARSSPVPPAHVLSKLRKATYNDAQLQALIASEARMGGDRHWAYSVLDSTPTELWVHIGHRLPGQTLDEARNLGEASIELPIGSRVPSQQQLRECFDKAWAAVDLDRAASYSIY